MASTFQPDYAVAPGATLKEALEERNLSQADLAQRTGMAEKTISQIINGIAPITYETAAKLDLALGIPARFWNKRELTYRETIVRLEEEKELAANREWLRAIPTSFLKQHGFIETSSEGATLVRQVLRFFGVSSVEAWTNTWLMPTAQYRGGIAQKKHPGYVAAWLRIGELNAASVECATYNDKEFYSTLSGIRTLTAEPVTAWYQKLHDMCAACGVVVAIIPEIPGGAVSGVTRWLTKDKALLQLSLKYKTDDQFWFTFFHEAGHILRHGKRDVFIEDGQDKESDDELDADAFARDILIPPSRAFELPLLRSKAAIRQFAASIGIAPGIVVGRLQRDEILPPSHCNDLKRKFKWSDATKG